MKVDAHTIRPGTVLDADLCIVGGGPAGITLAREFLGNGKRIVCLESGGVVPEDSAQVLNEGEFVGAPYSGLRRTRHRQLGGTACVWNTPVSGEAGAKYLPLDPIDFAPRPDLDRDGWPFDAAHLAPFYDHAQRMCGLGPFDYGATRWGDASDVFAPPDARVRRAVYQFGPARPFTHTYLEEIAASDEVELIHHATACGLEHDAGRSVTAIEVGTLEGNRFRVRSKLFVLAAGAVENARLLLVSREPGREALGNGHDWVGRCFMEHPRDRSLTLIASDPELYATSAFYDRHSAIDGTVIGGRLAVEAKAALDAGLVNGSVTLLPLARAPGRAAALLRRLARRVAGRQTGPPVGYGWSAVSRPERLYMGFQILLNVEQLPHRDNRVVLASTKDALGVPRAAVHWRWSAEDHARLEKLRNVFAEALGAAGVGRIETSGDAVPDPNAHHHAGTTRMHVDARHGAVDADGRVHGTDNLYATGGSVFPSSGFANPTLTIVALALRLAEHLKGRL